MKKLVLLFAFATFSLSASNCVLSGSASVWGSAGVWTACAGGTPGNGDTVSIPDGMWVTVQGAVTVGASGANNTTAINLNSHGQIILSTGATLTVRGDVSYTGGASVPCSAGAGTGPTAAAAVVMQAGSVWIWDSSASSSPTTTKYWFGNTSNFGCNSFLSQGTAGARNTISSNITGGAGAGYFTANGFTSAYAGGFTAPYTDISNIGDATNPGWQVYYDYGGIAWSVNNSTFTNCGRIDGGNINTNSTTDSFVHEYNVHSATASDSVFGAWGNSGGTGTVTIKNNSFDKQFSNNGSGAGFYPTGFTIQGNYFANGGIWSAAQWASFQGNLWRQSDSTCNGQGCNMIYIRGGSIQNIYFLDEPVSNNPHGPALNSPGTMNGDIGDHAGQISNSVSAFMQYNSPSAGYYSLLNSILLPNELSHASWWIAAAIENSPQEILVAEHDTIVTDSWFSGPGIVSWHPTTQITPVGTIASLRSTIFWNPSSSDKSYKLYSYCQTDPANGCAANLNPGLPTSLDYNSGWNTLSDGFGYSNGGNGYADNFTSIPGQHDLDVLFPGLTNPQFVDPTRNVASFDSAYLGNTAAAWNNNTALVGHYSVGQMVSNADSTIYLSAANPGGQTINYRYVNGTYTGEDGTEVLVGGEWIPNIFTCGGANPLPGGYTGLSRACWEWASLADFRAALTATATQSGTCPGVGAHQGTWSTTTGIGIGTCIWDDQTIGAHNTDILMTHEQWVRAGMAPTNSLYAGAAHDGTDIGAVPVNFLTPSGGPALSPAFSMGGTGSIVLH